MDDYADLNHRICLLPGLFVGGRCRRGTREHVLIGYSGYYISKRVYRLEDMRPSGGWS